MLGEILPSVLNSVDEGEWQAYVRYNMYYTILVKINHIE